MEQENFSKYTYKGAIHIHSNKSDGTANVDYISKIASRVGLSWIIITDHNYLDFEEGIYNGVYVIKGEEISPETENHYLALGIDDRINPNENPQEYIDLVHEQGGFGIAAHPDESEARKNNYPPIKWNKNFIPDGVEIWNWFSSWADNLNTKNIFTLIYSFLFKNNLVKKAPSASLAWWDKLNLDNEKIVPAICGIDAHALRINQYIIPVTVFPYSQMLKTICNLIILPTSLSKDFKKAKEQILNAIKNGNNVILNNQYYENIPFITIENKNKIAYCGEFIELDEKTYLNVNINKKALIKIIFNGQEFYEIFAKKCKVLLSEIGKYRVEIFANERGLVYSNPIVVV